MDQDQRNDAPIRKPAPPQIDPKKFVGGDHLEKIKSILRDVDEFAAGVKERGKTFGETMDIFREKVVKFGEVVDLFQKVVEKLEDGNGKVA
jgi:hypothetical protein